MGLDMGKLEKMEYGREAAKRAAGIEARKQGFIRRMNRRKAAALEAKRVELYEAKKVAQKAVEAKVAAKGK